MVKKLPIEITLYIQNLLDEDYFFTELAIGWMNTLPNGANKTVYSSITIRI